jgi:hypothetical protein
MLNHAKFVSPFILKIASACDLTILNFHVFGAMEFIDSETFTKEGDLFLDSVSVRSGTPDITYREMLCQFKSSMYSVGITYFHSTTPGQLEEPIYLRKGGISELLVPTIDPYQENPEIVAIKRPFCIDGTTKIVLSKLYPHSTIKLYFYPEESMNLARGLCGRLSHKRFNSSIFLTGK